MEDFQHFYHVKIRPKKDPDSPTFLNKDDLSFQKIYEDIIESTLRSIPATKKNRQEAIYISCLGNDGLINPKEGNTKIRIELSIDCINSMDKITGELNAFLWTNVNKMINWVKNKLWNIPEIRQEMIGEDEHIESLLLRKSFDALIQ
jgi:hypothetical protein